MNKKNDPFYDEDFNITCPITNKDVLDDCHIVIEFGYGSDKDMTTYTFSAVHDEVGKKVVAYIQSLMPKGNSVEDFSTNVMDELFGSESS
tara:strand:- start:4680 stop:4949 length:270 start_codon:yes stop_codon:yes gene_type:complete